MFELWGLFCSVLWLIRSGPPKRKKMLFLGAQGKHHFFQISTYINIKIYRIEIDITLHYTTLINVIYIYIIYICAIPLYVLFVSSIFPFPGPLLSGRKTPQELPTLCGSSATGLFSAASQIASWGSQIAIACGESDLGFEDFFRRLGSENL